MKICILLLSLTLPLASCLTTKVDFRKINLADTSISFQNHTFNDFASAFKTLHPEEAYNLAETDAQKTVAKALGYIMQNRYENAVETFVSAMTEKDSLDMLWRYFPNFYYYTIAYNWEKLEKYESSSKNYQESYFAFYSDKPGFKIEFLEDSVIVPIEFSRGFVRGRTIIKIKINGKFYSFLIDTGCSKTVIGKNIAKQNNIVYENRELTGRSFVGNITLFSSVLSELDLGQIKISNFPIAVINSNDAVRGKFLFITFFKCDGIIGWDLLSKFDFTLDYKNKQLVLRKPIKKDIEQRNLFWYYVPIIKFYSNDYPILAFFDTGSSLNYFYQHPTLSKILEINATNKKRNKKFYAVSDEQLPYRKEKYYKYMNFQCYTIANNEISCFFANEILLGENKWNIYPINIDFLLGSSWFKNKAIRVDMLNGIFEISE